FFADSRDLGVFAGQDIPPATFLSSFSGELITRTEANQKPEHAAYMFDVDFTHITGETLVMDATNFGNVRVNHGCAPNAVVRPCYIDQNDLRKPLLAFFSSRNISRGEQLTISYSGHAPPPCPARRQKSDPIRRSPRALGPPRCECGAYNCRREPSYFPRSFSQRPSNRQQVMCCDPNSMYNKI
ncbi:hypothetical protein B0H11DRAFT_1746740, partial [Mycena galericulata]